MLKVVVGVWAWLLLLLAVVVVAEKRVEWGLPTQRPIKSIHRGEKYLTA